MRDALTKTENNKTHRRPRFTKRESQAHCALMALSLTNSTNLRSGRIGIPSVKINFVSVLALRFLRQGRFTRVRYNF